MIENGERELAEIVATLLRPGRFATGLDGGQQERNQNAHDCDDDQQLDQRESMWASFSETRIFRAIATHVS
jgi:hypothetical protein